MIRAARAVSVWRGAGRAAAIAVALLCGLPSSAAEKPNRIASIYLCSDQLLLRLAERNRIVSLNRFSADPSLSNEVDAAAGIALNRGRAEEILPLRPDLIIAGTYTAPATKALLRRLAIPVLELPVETDFNGVRRNIRRVAAALGEKARGEELIVAFDRNLATVAVAAPTGKKRPALMLYRFGGYSQGRNTLSDAIFEQSGFRNYAATRLTGVGRLSLERIVTDPPDAILLSDNGADRNSLSADTLAHPALRHLRRDLPTLSLPDRLWICGLTESTEAVRTLAAFRARAFDATPQRKSDAGGATTGSGP